MRTFVVLLSLFVMPLQACKDPPAEPAPPTHPGGDQPHHGVEPPAAATRTDAPTPTGAPTPTDRSAPTDRPAPNDPPAPADAAGPATPAQAGAAADVRALIESGASFQFALQESADALRMQTAICAQQSGGDAAKQAACLQAVTVAGAREGIRFERVQGKLFWVSFGATADGKEEIYLRGPIALLDSPAGELRFRPAGAFSGKQAAESKLDAFAPDKFLTVRAHDASTLVLVAPPPKGALTYHKR